MEEHGRYVTPLVGRYTSDVAQRIWSDARRHGYWRRLWWAIAKAQRELGVTTITEGMLIEMSEHLDDIDYQRAAKLEKEFRHDVVAHSRVYGEVCPAAAGIIHLGLASMCICDNAELIMMRESMVHIRGCVVRALVGFRGAIIKYADLPITGLSHLQPAQPVTLGKRLSMYAQDLTIDLESIDQFIHWLPFRGIKGPVGTKNPTIKLFGGDRDKAQALEVMVAQEFGFTKILPITGQTYTRKIDSRYVFVFADLASTLYRFAEDIRLMQSRKEVEEPFGSHQKGSSSMIHKHNPMKSERTDSLGRELMVASLSPLLTHALQMFERTLDDSAARRRYLAESFLLAEAMLILVTNIINGLVVHKKVIERNLSQEMPFLVAEDILLSMCGHGKDRDECYDRIYDHVQLAHNRVYEGDGVNDLVDRLKSDDYFSPILADIDRIMDPKEIFGEAPLQAKGFVVDTLDPLLQRFSEDLSDQTAELKV